MNADHKRIRAVILGAELTGKSALVKKYLHGVFTEEYNPSFEGTDQKDVVFNGTTYTLELIAAEPAGENMLCQTGDSFILLYAINNRKSFQHLRQLHAQIARAKALPDLSNFPVYLVGSKADLEGERVVSLEEGRQLAIELRCQKLFEVSAKDHVVEIDDLFQKLVKQCVGSEHVSTPISKPTLPPQATKEPTSPPPQRPEPTPLTSADSPRRSSVMDRLKFGSLRGKSSMQSLSRKKSGSFGESILGMGSRNPSKVDVRSVSYNAAVTNSSRTTSYEKPPTISRSSSSNMSPFKLDVDTSSWRETVKWPTEIIPEEDLRTTR